MHDVDADRWVVIPNWRKFQHYHDRAPTWIKLYVELRDRPEWCRLTLAERGLLVSLWIAYASADGRLKTADIPTAIGRKNVGTSTLKALNRAGFVRFVSRRPLALTRPREGVLRTPKSALARGSTNGHASALEKKMILAACPDCGTGAGLHVADCPRATRA